jgi:hypothetical protein
MVAASLQPTSATLAEVRSVPLPEETKTYSPLGHWQLISIVSRLIMDLMDAEVQDAQYFLANEGKRLFGMLFLRNGSQVPGVDRMVGIRNSYDKHIAAAVAPGLSPEACKNIIVSGAAMSVIRKHTGKIVEDIEETLVISLYRAKGFFRDLEQDCLTMQDTQYTGRDAFGFFGQLYGEKVLAPRQLPLVHQDWHNPRHVEFEPRTLWSAYNCATEHLKGLEPGKILTAHTQLHSIAMDIPAKPDLGDVAEYQRPGHLEGWKWMPLKGIY